MVFGQLGLISHSSVPSEENFLLALSLVSPRSLSLCLSPQYKPRGVGTGNEALSSRKNEIA